MCYLCLCVCVYVCVCVSVWYVCICVYIDLRLGWEPCSVPAWLINGVVMAIGRNEGTKRRRPASLDPYAPPGTRTVSHTHTFTLHALHLSDRHLSHSNNPVTQVAFLASWLLHFSFALYLSFLFSLLLNFFRLVFSLYMFFSFPPCPVPPSSSF